LISLRLSRRNRAGAKKMFTIESQIFRKNTPVLMHFASFCGSFLHISVLF
jgi:hypothetical protein